MSATQTEKVILELDGWDSRPYEVQRLHHGYRWETVGTYRTKAAAFSRAEAVQSDTDDNVRVLKNEVDA